MNLFYSQLQQLVSVNRLPIMKYIYFLLSFFGATEVICKLDVEFTFIFCVLGFFVI